MWRYAVPQRPELVCVHAATLCVWRFRLRVGRQRKQGFGASVFLHVAAVRWGGFVEYGDCHYLRSFRQGGALR